MISTDNNKQYIINLFDLVLNHIEDKLQFYYENYKSSYDSSKKETSIEIKFLLISGEIIFLVSSLYTNNNNFQPTVVVNNFGFGLFKDQPEIQFLLNGILDGDLKTEDEFYNFIYKGLINSKTDFLLNQKEDKYIINIKNYIDITNCNDKFWHQINILKPDMFISFLKNTNEQLKTNINDDEVLDIYNKFMDIISTKILYKHYFKNKTDFELFFNEVADIIHLIYEKNNTIDLSSIENYIKFLIDLNIKEIEYFVDVFFEKKKNSKLLFLIMDINLQDVRCTDLRSYVKKALNKHQFNKCYFTNKTDDFLFFTYKLNYLNNKNQSFNDLLILEKMYDLIVYDSEYVNKKILIYNNILETDCLKEDEIHTLKSQIEYLRKRNKDNFIEIK